MVERNHGAAGAAGSAPEAERGLGTSRPPISVAVVAPAGETATAPTVTAIAAAEKAIAAAVTAPEEESDLGSYLTFYSPPPFLFSSRIMAAINRTSRAIVMIAIFRGFPSPCPCHVRGGSSHGSSAKGTPEGHRGDAAS